MFGIGFFELVIIAAVVLIFFGPDKLPELARQLGKFFVHTRRITGDMKSAFDEVVRDAENEIVEEKRKAVRQVLEAVSTPPKPPDYEEKEKAHAEEQTAEGSEAYHK